MTLTIDVDGTIRYIYDEEMDLEMGEPEDTEIRRVSHVEPISPTEWIADMNPVNGPVLGPFGKRSEALKAEVEWIHENYL